MRFVDGSSQNSFNQTAVVQELAERIDSLSAALEEIRALVRDLAQPIIDDEHEPRGEADDSEERIGGAAAAYESAWQTTTPVDDPAIEHVEAHETAPDYSYMPPPLSGASTWGSMPSAGWTEQHDEVLVADEEDVAADETEAPDAEAAASTSYDDEAAREEVRRAVERMRAELGGGDFESAFNWRAHEPTAAAESSVDDVDPDAAARDEVRSAVEAARAELGSETPSAGTADWSRASSSGHTWGAIDLEEKPSEPQPSAAPPERRDDAYDDIVINPSVIIEDPDGRVELVNVYETLNRVNCADQAVLLNYTPHSVTVGLSVTRLPTVDSLKGAVLEVFARPCEIVSDGQRMAVTITRDG